LKFNSHLHILVSAGGLQESSAQWIPHLRLEKGPLMRMWRYAVIAHLRSALKPGLLRSDLSTHHLQRLLLEAYQNERHPRWIIFLHKIESKSHFLRYAARYVRRPPIASWRLLEVTDREVIFVTKDTKAGGLVPTRRLLSEFVRMLAPHVPDLYRHAIRYFGLLAPGAKGNKWAGLFVALSQEIKTPPRRLSWRDSLLRYFGFDPLIDSRGEEMRWVRRERPVHVKTSPRNVISCLGPQVFIRRSAHLHSPGRAS
jgi:hypothetical protein